MKPLRNLWRPVLAILSGLLLAAAFPPLGTSECAWMGLVPLMLLARYSTLREAFRWGFVAGLVFWLATISWLLRLSATWGMWPVVVLGWIGLSAYCALYMSAFCAIVAFLWPSGEGEALWGRFPLPSTGRAGSVREDRDDPDRPAGGETARNFRFLLLAPLAWVGLEYVRGVLFTGFPWNPLGVSQYRNVGLIQMASWGGVYAVSALIVFLNAAIAATFLRLAGVHRHGRGLRFSVELMAGLLLVGICWVFGIRQALRLQDPQEGDLAARVTAVQPNIPQLQKSPPEYAETIRERLRTQTEMALSGKPDLIVWPETAVPGTLREEPNAGLAVGLAAQGTPLLAGSVDVWSVRERRGWTDLLLSNGSFLVETNGTVLQSYRKVHLVPFGEYLPFDKALPFLRRISPLGYTCVPGRSHTVFRVPLRPGGADRQGGSDRVMAFSVLICFEDTIPSLARKSVRNGARMLVNQTNDAWFDGSSAAVQHMSHCVFRCVENRVPAVRCANTGVTCFIDAAGVVDTATQERLAGAEGDALLFQEGRMRLRDDREGTLYTRYGDLSLAWPSVLVALGLFVLVIRKGRSETPPGTPAQPGGTAGSEAGAVPERKRAGAAGESQVQAASARWARGRRKRSEERGPFP